ncbi:MAG: hypothetical protein ACXV8T_17080, partial [Acidimicrobiia bacterium]
MDESGRCPAGVEPLQDPSPTGQTHPASQRPIPEEPAQRAGELGVVGINEEARDPVLHDLW